MLHGGDRKVTEFNGDLGRLKNVDRTWLNVVDEAQKGNIRLITRFEAHAAGSWDLGHSPPCWAISFAADKSSEICVGVLIIQST